MKKIILILILSATIVYSFGSRRDNYLAPFDYGRVLPGNKLSGEYYFDTLIVNLLMYAKGTIKVDTILGDGGRVQIGDATATSDWGLNADDDLQITGKLEVDGDAFFDGAAYYMAALQLYDNKNFIFGSGGDVNIDWSTAQTNHGFIVGLGNTSRYMVICESADKDVDFGRPNSADPIVYLMNADASYNLQMKHNTIETTYPGFNFIALRQFTFFTRQDLSAGHKFEFIGSASTELTDTDAEQSFYKLNPWINQTGTAGYTAFDINVTEISLGSGDNNLLRLAVGGSEKFSISNIGDVTMQQGTKLMLGGAGNYAACLGPNVFTLRAGTEVDIRPGGNDYYSFTVDGATLQEYGNNAQQTITLGVGATTFAVTSNIVQVTGDGGANTIATITGAVVGHYTFIFVDGNVTISDDNTHASNTVDLDASNDFTSADDKVLQLVFDGTSWYKVNESTN